MKNTMIKIKKNYLTQLSIKGANTVPGFSHTGKTMQHTCLPNVFVHCEHVIDGPNSTLLLPHTLVLSMLKLLFVLYLIAG